jgi:predicted nucleic acid-binding protein
VRKLVVDTNVYIEAIRDAGARATLADWQRRVAPSLYQHSVVAAELLAGARTAAVYAAWHERWVAPAERVRRVIMPTAGSWLRAARLVVRLTERKLRPPGVAPAGFFNDCLLAATAVEHGFTLVTHNTRDFALLGRVEPALRWVRPLP